MATTKKEKKTPSHVQSACVILLIEHTRGQRPTSAVYQPAIKLNANSTIYFDMEIFLRRLLGVGVKKIVPIEMDLYANTHSYSLTIALTTSLLYTYKL